jgi:hypothetical protein
MDAKLTDSALDGIMAQRKLAVESHFVVLRVTAAWK